MPDDDPLGAFREAARGSDLAEALGMIQAHRDADAVGHWLIVWVEKRGTPDDPTAIMLHSHYADEIVGMGLARYIEGALDRGFETTDPD
jgi:hypothetical protein